jgi:hypothetical protein
MKRLADIAASLGIDAATARALLRRTRCCVKRYYTRRAARKVKLRLAELIAMERGANLSRDEAATLAELMNGPVMSAHENNVMTWAEFHALQRQKRAEQPLRPNALAPLDRLMSGR